MKGEEDNIIPKGQEENVSNQIIAVEVSSFEVMIERDKGKLAIINE